MYLAHCLPSRRLTIRIELLDSRRAAEQQRTRQFYRIQGKSFRAGPAGGAGENKSLSNCARETLFQNLFAVALPRSPRGPRVKTFASTR